MGIGSLKSKSGPMPNRDTKPKKLVIIHGLSDRDIKTLTLLPRQTPFPQPLIKFPQSKKLAIKLNRV